MMDNMTFQKTLLDVILDQTKQDAGYVSEIFNIRKASIKMSNTSKYYHYTLND